MEGRYELCVIFIRFDNSTPCFCFITYMGEKKVSQGSTCFFISRKSIVLNHMTIFTQIGQVKFQVILLIYMKNNL